MATGDFFSKSDKVSSGQSLVVSGISSSTGAAEIHSIASNCPISVLKEIDTNSNGTFDISIKIDQSQGRMHSQQNKIEISKQQNIRLRLKNEGESTLPIHVTGIEIAN